MTNYEYKHNLFNVHKMNDSQFFAEYKNHEINISKEENHWYIMVMDLDTGSYAYDGSWGDGSEHITEAVSESIRGSSLGA